MAVDRGRRVGNHVHHCGITQPVLPGIRLSAQNTNRVRAINSKRSLSWTNVCVMRVCLLVPILLVPVG